MNERQQTGEAERSLGCLNCTIQLSALKGFQCNPILRELAEAIRNELRSSQIEIAHLSMRLVPEIDVDGAATLSLSANQQSFEIGPELEEPVERCKLAMSVRAEAKPDHLHAAVTQAMNRTWAVFPNLFVRMAEMEHFRPSQSASGQTVAAG